MAGSEKSKYDPALFASGPNRDSRFKVVEQWKECENFPKDHPSYEIEFYHRQMNEEVNGMECAARALTDFPDTDWHVRMSIARQCYDEARHVEMFRRLLENSGGHVGQSPVMNFQYRIITKADTLAGRLVVQNRTFEAGGIDAIAFSMQEMQAKGNTKLVDLYDAQLADEIAHVRYANEYIAHAISEKPAIVMGLGRVMQSSYNAMGLVVADTPDSTIDYPKATALRLEAGFSPEELGLSNSLATTTSDAS